MINIESPKRKLQKQNDYQRHKLFRKILRRRKAQAGAQQEVAEKQLKKKLKIPKYDTGKTREVYTKDLSFDDTGGGVDRYGNKFDYVALPDVEIKAQNGTPGKDYDALYLSTNKGILDSYGGNKDYERAIVRIPQNETSKTAPSLSERLLAGDFDMYDSEAVYRHRSPEGTYTMFEEPYRLQTGRSLQTDMINEDPNVPGIEWINQKKLAKVNANETIPPYFSDITFGDKVNKINKFLQESGVTKTQIKGFF